MDLLCTYSSAGTVGFISRSLNAVAYLTMLSKAVAVRCLKNRYCSGIFENLLSF